MSFSEIISSLIKNEIGKENDLDSSWETISHEINRICRNREIPPSIAKKIETRNKTNVIYSSTTYSFPHQVFSCISSIINLIINKPSKKKMLVIFIDKISYEGEGADIYRL